MNEFWLCKLWQHAWIEPIKIFWYFITRCVQPSFSRVFDFRTQSQKQFILRPRNYLRATYFWGFTYHLMCKIGLKLSTFFWFYFVMELKKIVLLPIPTGWRDSNSPMGDGLYSAQWCFTNFVTHLGCYFHRTGRANKIWRILDTLCLWSEENRFDTHFNGLEGLQQSHGQYPISHQWVVTNIVDQKCTYWTTGNVVASKFYAHAEESYPWVMSWKNPLSRV